MIRINQIKLPLNYTEEMLYNKICRMLKTDKSAILSVEIIKKSIDARKKPDIFYSISVEITAKKEEQLVKRAKSSQITLAVKEEYCFPPGGEKIMKHRPVIIGSGPAGLFCAYLLASHGYAPIILERGKDVDARKRDVESFWETGILNTASNVQFGEGGAGTFSDGKLNTLVKDKGGRNRYVLSVFVKNGAPERILYEGKPHIGTDILIKVVKNMREQIKVWGGEFFFENQVMDFEIEGGGLKALKVKDKVDKIYRLACETAVLAIGHSARDTVETLWKRDIPMQAKAFAVGFRVEHPQKLINVSQYGIENGENLPAAAYKLAGKAKNGRGVYSFCMCPGGFVVNASSEEKRLAVNGMSYSGRNGENANSAIIVAVTPEDYGEEGPLAGIAFQRKIEEKAFEIGGGRVPVERFGDFRKEVLKKAAFSNRLSGDFFGEAFSPQIKGKYTYAKVSDILPEELNVAFIEGMEQFDKVIPGFADERVIIDGIESRTSSPVRIMRDETNQSEIRGLYPCGEGAGYAGGITSAAMDGMKIAEGIARQFKPLYTNVLTKHEDQRL